MQTFVTSFIENAGKHPEKVAVMDVRGVYTYKELNERSADLSDMLISFCGERGTDIPALRKEGKNGVRVGILLPRTKDYMTALLAVLRAGCAAVPVDAEYPVSRIRTILSDAGCAVLVTCAKLALNAGDTPVLLMEDIVHDEEQDHTSLDLSASDAEGFLIYTSGSTGKPKGVMHDQNIFCNTYDLLRQQIPVSENDITCCMAGFTFIASLYDLAAPLIAGGSVYIANDNEQKNTDMLYGVIIKRRITGMYLPPQLFAVMRELYGVLPLSYIITAGEKLNVSCAEDGNVYETYGSSEAGLSLIYKVGYDDPKMLGKPSEPFHAYLMDEQGTLIETPGVIGELCLSSPYLALGYTNMPEETADKFVDSPFEPGKKMFRSGDYMAYDDEGNLLFHGRKDRMIKLRGYRVELGEIEHVIRAHDAVSEAAVVIVRVSGAEKICCYYTGEESDDLKNHTVAHLPDYMVPDYFVRLETMPRNDRNKVDYPALNAMRPPVDEGDYVAPVSDTERRICEAYASVLTLDRVSAAASFFDLGGTSLSAALLISRLGDMGRSLSFQDIYANPTPSALAAFLSADHGTKIPAMDRDFYPLTKTQLGIYLEAMTGGSAATYTLPYLMRCAEDLRAEKIISAVRKVLTAHPSMKYVIRAGADGIPHMFLTPDTPVDIPVVDGAEEGRLDFMKKFMPVVSATDGLLFAFAVYRTPSRCYLALKTHLIFFDATSISLLIAELNRALTGQELLKEECTIQQAGMIEEEKMLDGSHNKARDYYTNLFKVMDNLPSLSGDLEGALTPGVSENIRYTPGTLTTERVKAFCDDMRITESTFFMGAMALLLGKYLNTKHVSFSTVYNGRGLAEMANTAGTLIKRIPVYGDLSKNIHVGEFFGAISRQIFSTMSNDIYSFDEVLKTCPVNEDVEFIYQGDLFTDKMGTSAGENLIEGDKYFMEHYHTGMVTGCMSIQFFATDGLYNMTLEYRNEKFSEEWVQRFAKDLFTVAEGLLGAQTIGEISLLTEEDKKQLASFNDTYMPLPFVPVHAQIHAHAVKKPEDTAVIAAGRRLGFRELDCLSNQVCEALKEKGAEPDHLIGVLFEREVWAYVAELGILKAGSAFLPFIPDYPDDRIDFCMEDAGGHLLLTTNALKAGRKLPEKHYRILTLEEIFGETDLRTVRADKGFADISPVPVSPETLAYCIYTSGSTGRPKGVMIEHRNIANYVHRNEKSVEIMHYASPGRISLALASFSFDVSVVEAFVPLCNGNPVVLATETEIHDPASFARLVKAHDVNGMTCTPTYLLSLLDIPESREAIRQITFFDIGAEAFPGQLYDRLRDLRKDSVILNVYGPTECTMGCSAVVMDGNESVTVGPPIANTVFYVADPFGLEMPVGMKGELIICGDQVGRGYVNLPDKTAAAFFMHDGKRAYRSGDLAAWTKNGEIRIFGRIDNQIKLRGFRIELDEIEKVMTEFSGIKTGVATVQKTGGTEYLAGYYTAAEEIAQEALRKHLQEKLPEYMVPNVLMQLNEMPMTANGKVNRKALPAPDLMELKAEYLPPETETEKILCGAFEKTLHLDHNKVGLLDDFFDLGGDSLKAMVVLAEADLDGLTAADVFRLRTPGAIAKELEKRTNRESLDEREKNSRRLPHAPSPVQQYMIDCQLFRPFSTMWSNTHLLARFGEEIEAQKLCDALNRALQHHPGLSVSFFFDENNVLKQQYVPGLLPEVKVRELLPETEDALADILVTPFQRILNACLCKANVFRGRKGCYLFLDVHHLLMDGGSLSVILGDIVNAYLGRELKKDYYFATIAQEEERLASGDAEKDSAYFSELYDEEDWCVIPPPDHESTDIDHKDRIRRLNFDAEDVLTAEEHWGASVSVMAIGAGLLALSRFTGKNHVMNFWIFNNRLAPEVQNIVGMLIKSLPVALRMEEIPSCHALLKSVKEQVAGGISHCSCEFAADSSVPYVNDEMEINLQIGINGNELDELNAEVIELADAFSAAGGRLSINLLENEYGDGGYDSEMEYAGGLFDAKRMDTFHDLYIRIFEDMVARKDLKEYFGPAINPGH